MKNMIFIGLFLLSFIIFNAKVYANYAEENTTPKDSITANSIEEDITKGNLIENITDYTDIDNALAEILGKNEFNFGNYVKDLISGKQKLTFESVLIMIKDSMLSQLTNNKNLILQILSIGIIAAIFTNFSNVFQNNQIAETGFYICYLLLFVILAVTFQNMVNLATNTLSSAIHFMRILIPTYFVSVALAAGTSTALVFYETTLIIITVGDLILLHFVIPLINIYMVIAIANNISKENFLSKLSSLIKLIIDWTLKTVFVTIIGLNTIQGLIVPIADSLKSTAINKTSRLIPGIGNVFNLVTETVIGSSALIKNAIGVAGLIALILICFAPVIKLAIFVLIYELSASVIQPISDKRFVNCISDASVAVKLLLKTVCIGTILFLVTIAMISGATNAKYFAG